MQFEDLYARQRGLRHLLQDEQNPFSLMTVLRFACRWVSRLILPVWRWRSNVLGETKRGPSQAWRRRLKIAKEKALNYKRKPISFHRWHKSRRDFYDDHLSPCSYQWKRFHTQQREWLRNMSDLLNRRVLVRSDLYRLSCPLQRRWIRMRPSRVHDTLRRLGVRYLRHI